MILAWASPFKYPENVADRHLYLCASACGHHVIHLHVSVCDPCRLHKDIFFIDTDTHVYIRMDGLLYVCVRVVDYTKSAWTGS